MTIESTGERQLERYRRIAREIACCIMRDVLADIDALAMGRDDYENELVIHALETLHHWRGSSRVSQGGIAEHKYVCKCIWNKARSFVRRRLRLQSRASMVILTEARGGVDLDLEERAICRQTLRILRTRMKTRDWQILCQIALTEVDPECGSTRKSQRARQRVRKKAREVSLFLE